MHPAPSLREAPPQSDESRPGQHHPMSPDSQSRQSHSASPPVRKDTASSTSTSATGATVTSIASNDTTGTGFSNEVSPPYSNEAIFPVKDGVDNLSPNRRTNNRRRTGPLSQTQRQKAALIRKMGACNDCRRRRVACHPNHHNMTWEDAERKFSSHSPIVPPGLAPLLGRPGSPVLDQKPIFTQDPQAMDVDNSPTPRPERPALNSESRALRTPLPSGPRPDKPVHQPPITLPGIENFRSDLHGTISRALTDTNHRSRYAAVQVLLLYWQDEEHDAELRGAIDELISVLSKHYHYTFESFAIPSSSDDAKSSSRWLSHKINDLIDNPDQRDVLKIVYYNGHTYLNGHREMMLASPRSQDSSTAIRWSSIQQILEGARADTLVIMDAAYYPSTKMMRERGVLEIIAASASEEHAQHLGRNTFTRALIQELYNRASQRYRGPFSAAELHAKLFSNYPSFIQERHPEKPVVTSFPAPLHIMMTENPRLPSILLAPLRRDNNLPNGDIAPNGPHVTITFNLTNDAIDTESWMEWLRVMPEVVRDLKIMDPYRDTLR